MDEYKNVFLKTEDDLKLYKKSFDKNGVEKNIQKLNWVHFKNPVKEQLTLLNLTNSKEVASIYATMPVLFKINNEVVKACQSLDTLTDENHRGKGLFVNSAMKVFEKAAEQSYTMVYGFPNGNSVGGFTRKLDWKLLDPVPFIFKPLKTGYFLKKIFGSKIGNFFNFSIASNRRVKLQKNQEIKPIDIFDEAATNIWTNFSSDIKVALHRDAAYLNWRYIDKPGESYEKLGFYENGTLLGFVVFNIKSKHGGKVGYIMELLYNKEIPNVSKLLMSSAINHMKKIDADVILAWSLEHSDNFQAFKATGFKVLPKKLRPIELHWGYRSFVTNSFLDKRENWFLSYSDSDTV